MHSSISVYLMSVRYQKLPQCCGDHDKVPVEVYFNGAMVNRQQRRSTDPIHYMVVSAMKDN